MSVLIPIIFWASILCIIMFSLIRIEYQDWTLDKIKRYEQFYRDLCKRFDLEIELPTRNNKRIKIYNNMINCYLTPYEFKKICKQMHFTGKVNTEFLLKKSKWPSCKLPFYK